MYAWERGGRVWIVEDGHRLHQPMIDISEEVGAWRDFGLLGFALDPQFRENGYIYLAYTVDHHHLTKFGTTNYHSSSNEYFMATIHRITRYRSRASDDFRTVDYTSRKVLVGESITNGFPSLFESHGIGSLVFGSDGTLLAGCGDGATHRAVDNGSVSITYYSRALSEGIIRSNENVGAYRAQMVDSLSGKIIRIDPETGDGIPGNPFYDPAAPRAARSRVWSLGLRNPFRFALRPGTGSAQRNDANPGVLYIGDSGWLLLEDLNVATGPGQNFGWPIYEGFQEPTGYSGLSVANREASNPLFSTTNCTQQFFTFRQLLVQDSLHPPVWLNPCDTNQHIPTNIHRFVHRRPAIEWRHTNGPARTGIYTTNGLAAVTNIGGPGSPVSGAQFGGSSSIGGTWYHGSDFPIQYSNTYFQADFEGQWIRSFVFDSSNNPVSVQPFLSDGGLVVCIATHPVEGSLYYATWTNGLKRITYTGGGNKSPRAVATADKTFGPSPLTVQFDGSASVDPETFPLAYLWNFGDGSAASTEINPSHVFSAPEGVPTSYPVTLTVTDNSNATAQATLLISVNNTPPEVTITSPTNGTRYPLTGPTTYNLSATISDAEHGADQLICEWRTILHHNNHTHADPPDTNCVTTAVITPFGCFGETYFYDIALKVTDAAGLSTTSEVRLYPDCGAPPVLKYLSREGTNAIRWQLTGDTNHKYAIQGSTNLLGWSLITNVQPLTGTAEFIDGTSFHLRFRFYRAILVP